MASACDCCWRAIFLLLIVLVVAVTSNVQEEDAIVVQHADDDIQTSPLFDVGRVWLCATVRQAVGVIDVFCLTVTALLAFAVVCLIVVVRLYRFLFVPIDRVKLLGDVGYVGDGRQSLKDVAEQVKRRRAVGDVPPVYPNGWFALIESRSLSVGDVKNICCLGKMHANANAQLISHKQT